MGNGWVGRGKPAAQGHGVKAGSKQMNTYVPPEKMREESQWIVRGDAMLEVIDKGSPTDSHPVPLLFVHGACSAAEVWDDHFLNFLAAKGYRVCRLSNTQWRFHNGDSRGE